MTKKKQVVAAITLAGTSIFAISSVNAQQLTGAGSYTQPSIQYQQNQAEALKRANTYYYRPAPSIGVRQPQTQYIANPSGIPGYPPVPVKLSPQAVNGISTAVSGCATSAAMGMATGGVPKAVVGCGFGAFGLTRGQILRPQQAY